MAKKKTIEQEINEFLTVWDFEHISEFFKYIEPLMELYNVTEEDDWVAKEVGKETGKQAGYGAAGEAVGSAITGQEIDPRAVVEEALGEIAGAPMEAVTTYRSTKAAADATPTPPPVSERIEPEVTPIRPRPEDIASLRFSTVCWRLTTPFLADPAIGLSSDT